MVKFFGWQLLALLFSLCGTSRSASTLRGAHLRLVAYANYSMAIYKYSDGRYSGFIPEIWNWLALKGGFTYSVDFVPRNTSYDIWVKQVVGKNSTFGYDFTFLPLTIKRKRILEATSTIPILSYGFIPAVRKPEPRVPDLLDRTLTFTKPFTPGLWGVILLSAFFSGSFLWYLERTRSSLGVSFKLSDYDKFLVSSLRQMSGGGMDVSVTGDAARWFSVAWTLVVMLILKNYTANLASFYSTLHFSESLDSFQQMIMERSSIVARGSTAPGWVRDHAPANPLLRAKTTAQSLHMVANGTAAAHIGKDFEIRAALAETVDRKMCELHVVGQSLSYSYMGFLANPRHQTTLLNQLNHLISDIMSSGKYEELMNLYVIRQPVLPCPPLHRTSQALGVSDLSGLFMLLALSAGAVLVARAIKRGTSCAAKRAIPQRTARAEAAVGLEMATLSTAKPAPPRPALVPPS